MRNKDYTLDRLEFLAAGYLKMNVRDLTVAFNNKFGCKKTAPAISTILNRKKIRCGRAGANKLKKRTKHLTHEQEQFVRENYKNKTAAEMTGLFNSHFKTSKTLQQIISFVHNHGINSGRSGCFPKGHKSWNSGTKGQGLTGENKNSFKKGNIPKNRKPIGSERICSKDGFILIKVAETNPHTGFPTRYKHKHRHIWEKANGDVPAGMVVAFKDGDKLNCDLDNLMLISRAELLTLNQYGYRDLPDELRPAVRTLTKLEVKTREIFKKGNTPCI